MSGMLDRMVMVVIVATLMSWPLAAAETMTPLERLASTPKGQLENPLCGLRQRRRGRPQDLPFARLRWLSRRRRRRGHGRTAHQ